METSDFRKKGKAIEHFIISELLKNDFDVYVPVVDDGTDFIIKNRQGGFVEIQVKSRNIQGNEGLFFIKNFKPRYNFFIICHNLNTGDFFCMPSKKFYEDSTLDRKTNQRTISYSKIKKHYYTENKEGIALLKRALEDPDNQITNVLEI